MILKQGLQKISNLWLARMGFYNLLLLQLNTSNATLRMQV